MWAAPALLAALVVVVVGASRLAGLLAGGGLSGDAGISGTGYLGDKVVSCGGDPAWASDSQAVAVPFEPGAPPVTSTCR